MNENEIIEEWLPICGYECLYEVSNLGKVKSLNYNHTKQEKILKQGKNKDGYLIVTLCKEGKMKICYVHRLVANAFIPNPNNYPTVNHKNEIKTDNRVENLEWMNMKQQVNHGTAQQRRTANTDWKAIAEKLTNRQDLSKQVYQYDKDGNLIKIWDSTAEAGRNGFDFRNISDCCLSKRNFHRGYIWSYYPI